MIIGLSGFIGCGKGTVAAELVEKYNYRQDSFAASLKDACASLFDWPRHLLEGDTAESRQWREVVDPWWSAKLKIENFTPRLALQLMGTDVLRNNFNRDLWFITVENRIRKNPEQNVVISDVRFQNEVAFIKEQNGLLIRINRGNLPVWYDVALMANNGNLLAKEVMNTTYANVHSSEWSWIGSKFDFQVNNDSTIDYLKDQIKDIIDGISRQHQEGTERIL